MLNLKYANLKARYFTFADDTILVYTGDEERALNNIVNEDLNLYLNWLYYNKLKINIDKTKYMIFKQKNKQIDYIHINMNNLTLEEVQDIKYLGLIIDNNLNWSQHIKLLSNKILSMIPIIYKCRNYLTNKTKLKIYNAFFLSHFRYQIPIWGTCGETNFKSAQILQNKVLKILFNYNWLTSTEMLYRELKISKLETIFRLEQAKLMYKIINNKQRCNINILMSNNVHNHETRSQNNIYCKTTKTNIGLNNPIVQASKTYNKIPEDIKNHNKYYQFIKHVKLYLGFS